MKPQGIRLLYYFKEGGKYVGCVHCHDGDERCVCVCSSAEKALLWNCDIKQFSQVGCLKYLHFSYTGGIYYEKDKCVYGAPRNAEKLLRINTDTWEVSQIGILDEADVTTNVYGHHYCGRLVGNCLYCPPRLADYLLVINLDTYEIDKIYHPVFKDNCYNGAILHPNGKLYFTPMRGSRLAEFDPGSMSIRMIGPKISAYLFGGCTYSDGRIFSYSTKGLYEVNLQEDTVRLICGETVEKIAIYGSYGTVLHYNGKIYNIPGDSPFFYEFEPKSMICRMLYRFSDGRFNKAKWAGGALLENGNIFLVPAFGRFAAEIVFDGEPQMDALLKGLVYSQYFNPL